MSRNAVQAKEVLNHAILICFKYTLFCAYLYHGRNFVTAYADGLFTAREEFHDVFRNQHKGVGDNHHTTDNKGCRTSQRTPIACANTLGDDFRKYQNKDGEDNRNQSKALFTPCFCSSPTDTRGANRMSYRIQAKDG